MLKSGELTQVILMLTNRKKPGIVVLLPGNDAKYRYAYICGDVIELNIAVYSRDQ